MKYSKIAGALRWTEGTIVLRKGQSIDDDHPLVAERPDIWGDEAPGADIASTRVQSTMTSGPAGVRVEKPPVVQAPVVKAPPRDDK